MTDPISNERLAEMLAEVQAATAAAIGEWPYKASAGVTFDTMCSILTELQSRRQSPAGVGSTASCPTCHGTGDNCGNSDFGQCDDCGGTGILTTLALSTIAAQPAGVEPVAWQHRGARGGWITTDEETDYSERSLYASPPKAVTITDEMVERASRAFAAIAFEAAFEADAESEWHRIASPMRAALTATLSSEAQP